MALNGTAWTPLGPSPISEGGNNDNGLVSSIAVHPFNRNILYIGTVGGGVWRSADGGITWTPIFDRQVALGIGEPGCGIRRSVGSEGEPEIGGGRTKRVDCFFDDVSRVDRLGS